MGEERSIAARLGIAALNLLTPGLAWFRLGDWRKGLQWLVLLLTGYAGVLIAMILTSTPTFGSYAIFVGALIVITITLFAVPIVTSWRASAIRQDNLHWWMRWYTLIAIWLSVSLISQIVPIVGHRYYRPFYLPGESMAPTIALNEKILADMRPGRPLNRGDIVLLDTGGPIRVYRLIGLPGDRVALRGGVLILNGKEIGRPVGKALYDSPDGPIEMLRVEERLPGETGSHIVIDSGYVPEIDDIPEIRVPAGRIFVMGDNRDRAADSRVPPDRNGIGLPAIGAVIGRPLFITWSHDHSRIGMPLSD